MLLKWTPGLTRKNKNKYCKTGAFSKAASAGVCFFLCKRGEEKKQF